MAIEKYSTLQPQKSPKRIIKGKLLTALGATGVLLPYPQNTERLIERKILLQAPFNTNPSSGGGPIGDGHLLLGLISYWIMGENSGTRVDSMGVSNLTDVSANIPSTPTGILGGRAAGVFPASCALQAQASSSAYAIGAGKSFTLNMWSSGAGTFGGWLFAKTSGEYGDFVSTPGFVNTFEVVEIGTLANVDLIWTQPNNGGLSMLTFGYDAANAVTFVHASQAGVFGVRQTMACAGVVASNHLLTFQNLSGGGGAPASQGGSLQDVGFWGRALSVADVTSLYNAGAGKAFATFTS